MSSCQSGMSFSGGSNDLLTQSSVAAVFLHSAAGKEGLSDRLPEADVDPRLTLSETTSTPVQREPHFAMS